MHTIIFRIYFPIYRPFAIAYRDILEKTCIVQICEKYASTFAIVIQLSIIKMFVSHNIHQCNIPHIFAQCKTFSNISPQSIHMSPLRVFIKKCARTFFIYFIYYFKELLQRILYQRKSIVSHVRIQYRDLSTFLEYFV